MITPKVVMINGNKVCKIEGCGRPLAGRGLCDGHYRRLRELGDPLLGKPLRKSKPTRYTNLQWLRDHVDHDSDECLLWPFVRTGKGYGHVTVGGKTKIASRVMCAFVNGEPPTPEHQSAHSCGNGHLGCVNPRHLSWKTNDENIQDKIAHGRSTRGERQWQSKLTATEAKQIRSLLGTASHAEIAQKFGVNKWCVADISRGKTWGWIE